MPTKRTNKKKDADILYVFVPNGAKGAAEDGSDDGNINSVHLPNASGDGAACGVKSVKKAVLLTTRTPADKAEYLIEALEQDESLPDGVLVEGNKDGYSYDAVNPAELCLKCRKASDVNPDAPAEKPPAATPAKKPAAKKAPAKKAAPAKKTPAKRAPAAKKAPAKKAATKRPVK